MKIIYSLLVAFAVSTMSLYAQNIKGTVKSQNGEAIGFANIVVLNSVQATTSDKEGNYSLPLPKSSYEISVNAIGYATQIQKLAVTDTDAEVNFTLTESSKELGEVIVTAQKIEENALKTPIAITSLSAKKIEDARIWGLANLNGIVPNYLYQEAGVGFQQIQGIRGIQVFSENPAISTYVDDVNSLDILANVFALADVERIEILRGPQGTLFGRNAMGGVINIITKKPTNKTTGFAEASVGNLGLQRYNIGIKTPIIKDKFFFGVNGVFQKQDGFLKNDTTGTSTKEGSVQGKTVGGETNIYGNVYLKWIPMSKFSATLNLKAQTDRSDASGFFIRVSDEKKAFANPDKINLGRIGSHRRDIVNSALTLKYFASKFTLTSISAYQSIGLGYKNIDAGGVYFSFRDNELGKMLPPQEVLSQELRINSTNQESRFSYTAGLYGFTQTGYEPTTNLAYQAAPNSYTIYKNVAKNEGIAAFGQLSYNITEKLQATAGLRYDYELRKSTFNGYGDATYTAGVYTENRADTSVQGSYQAISPKLAVSYSLAKSSSVYLSYTRGFRAGGVNAQRLPAELKQTYNPEYSDNYEAGFKTYAWNKKLSFNLAAFYIHWKDIQFFNLVGPFTFARENVGNANSMGVELEASALPINNLQIDASVGLNATKYEGFELKRLDPVTYTEVKTDITGKKLPNAPSHTLFLAAQYAIPINPNYKVVIRGEVRNIGSYYTDIQNDLQQKAYTLLNTRFGLAAKYFDLFFWVQNISDERYLIYGSPDTSFNRSVRMASPRTFGTTLTAKF